MNITATDELRVWLEVPDTAWWLQLEIPEEDQHRHSVDPEHSITQ